VDVSYYLACVIGFGEVRCQVKSNRAKEMYLSAVRGHFARKSFSCRSDCSSLLCHLETCRSIGRNDQGYGTFLK
jgi:hypothetical protein